MKKTLKLYSTFLLFFIIYQVSCQQIEPIEGEVIYKIKFALKQMSHTQSNEKYEDWIVSLKPTIEKLDYKLKFNSEESIYEILNGLDDEDGLRTPATIIAGKGIFYTSKTQKTIIQREIQGEYFLITPNSQTLKWNITNEKKSIAEFNCIKATTKVITKDKEKVKTKNISAWFTPDINAPFGPKTYHGLPGLILELTENNLTYHAQSIKMQEQKIKKPNKGTKITKAELNQYFEEKAKERFGIKN